MPDPAFMEIIREQMLADRDRQSQALQPRHDVPPGSVWWPSMRQEQDFSRDYYPGPIDPGIVESPGQEIGAWPINPGHLPPGGTEWGDNSGFSQFVDGSRPRQTYAHMTEKPLIPQYTKEQMQDLAFKAARSAGIDPWMFLAQMRIESHDWNQNALSTAVDENGKLLPDELQAHGAAQIRIKQLIGEVVSPNHPEELARLSKDNDLRDAAGRPLWAEGRTLDPYNPVEAYEYAAKLVLAFTRIRLGNKKWTHDPGRKRTSQETRAEQGAASDYNIGMFDKREHKVKQGKQYGLRAIREARGLKSGHDKDDPDLFDRMVPRGTQDLTFGDKVERADLFEYSPDEHAMVPDDRISALTGERDFTTVLSDIQRSDFKSMYTPGILHRVEAGETLKSIARDYGSNYLDIAKHNNIENPNIINEFQEIHIPSEFDLNADGRGILERVEAAQVAAG